MNGYEWLLWNKFTWLVITGSVIVVSSSIASFRITRQAKRRMRQSLGRSVNDSDLASLNTWMKVRETQIAVPQLDISQASFASAEAKVYRFSVVFQLYHCAMGGGALFFAAYTYPYHIKYVWMILLPFAVYMIARPLVTSVTVDQFAVTHRGLFPKESLKRSSMTAIERRGELLYLWGNLEQKERLTINPGLYSFDEEWNAWLRTYRDLSRDKPLKLF